MRSWRCCVPNNPAAIRPATLIDSCVLLDVITGDQHRADWSVDRGYVATGFVGWKTELALLQKA